MARKKAVTEPQEEQMQDAAVPAEGMGGAEPGPSPLEDTPDGGMAPGSVNSVPDGAIPADSGEGSGGEFPAGDDMPFDGASDGEVPSQDAAPGEPPAQDGLPPGSADAGDQSEDYAAFLQAASGGVEPIFPPETPPLLLGGTEENGAFDAGGLSTPPEDQSDFPPPMPEAPGMAKSSTPIDRPAPTRVIDRRTTPRQERERVLTIDPRAEVQTQEDLEDMIWHELQNANRTKHILTGKLDSVGRTQNGMDTAIVLFKGVRVLIPLKEMMVHTGQVPSGPEYVVWLNQVTRILHARLDSDIDFVVGGIDEDSRTVVGSRREAMRRKRKRFYLDVDELGNHMIEEGRVVQARVVAVADKLLRVEVFGVECNITAKGSAWMWAGSARENHFVGELILVRIRKIDRDNVDRIAIQVDSRGVFGEGGDNLSQCQVQCRYVGQVMAVHKGVVFVRLNIGVNAIAHSCLDMRMPGKKDTVSFTVTRLDEKNGIAIGLITRIIKQNL